jgi:hypothetical protein
VLKIYMLVHKIKIYMYKIKLYICICIKTKLLNFTEIKYFFLNFPVYLSTPKAHYQSLTWERALEVPLVPERGFVWLIDWLNYFLSSLIPPSNLDPTLNIRK